MKDTLKVATRSELSAHGLEPAQVSDWVRFGWLRERGSDFEVTALGRELLGALAKPRRRPGKRRNGDVPRAPRRRGPPELAVPKRRETQRRVEDSVHRDLPIPDTWLPALAGLRRREPPVEVRRPSFAALEAVSARQLPERLLAIVVRRGGGETLDSIGGSLRITRERVRQIEGQGLRVLAQVAAADATCERLLREVTPTPDLPIIALGVESEELSWFGVAMALVKRRAEAGVLRRGPAEYLVADESWRDRAMKALKSLEGRGAYLSPAELAKATGLPTSSLPWLPVIAPTKVQLTACGAYANEGARVLTQFIEVARLLKWWGHTSWHYSQLGRAVGEVRGEPDRFGPRASLGFHTAAKAAGRFGPVAGLGMWRLR